METNRIAFPPSGPRLQPTPCCALVFDHRQDLLWTGNDAGRITSFQGPDLRRYTSYRGHLNEGPVKQILPVERGIVSISSKSVHLSIRRGLTQWHLSDPAFINLTCTCMLEKGGQGLLVAGRQSNMFVVNTEIGEIQQTLDASDQYTHLCEGGKYICAATSSGKIHLLSSVDFTVQKVFSAHNGAINDMHANKDFLVTCGWSPRQQFGNMLDPMAKVFDLKNLRPAAPVVFHAGAAYVRMHPRMMTTAIIVSQHGQMQLVDVTNPAVVNVRHMGLVDECHLVGLDFAPSGNTLIFADSMSSLQLWGHPSKLTFTDMPTPIEFADSTPSDQIIMDWNSTAPLNSIGMPYYREQLLSSWPSDLIFEVGAPPQKIDTAMLGTLKAAGMGSYGPNPRVRRRNQAHNARSDSSSSDLTGPKFLSEKVKDGDTDEIPPRRMSEALKLLEISQKVSGVGNDVPAMYRNVEIKYSKFGVDDFDFEFYNQTNYSGLETHIANSYLNSFLQLLRFTTRTRNLALQHTATNCIHPPCILCEVGFLTDMLEKAEGQNCQATNFLKVFSAQQETESLRLLEEVSPNPPSVMIQGTSRYLLDWMAKDYARTTRHMPDWTLYQALRTSAVSLVRCANCFHEVHKRTETIVHDLAYVDHLAPRGPAKLSFSQALRNSIGRLDQARGWCSRCGKYQVSNIQKNIIDLPDVLTINTAIQDNIAKQLWSHPGWLPSEIGIILNNGVIHCCEGRDLASLLHRGSFPVRVYELVGVVAEIKGDGQNPHLVCMANASHTKINHASHDLPDDWHLFNDFLVRPITAEEALHFDASWKLPMVLTYQVKAYRHGVDDSWKHRLSKDLLLATYRREYKEDPALFRRLDIKTELPGRNTAVGIDAEFVLLQQAEIEIRSDGSASTLRPGRFGLGRVSVIRGETLDSTWRRRSSSSDSRDCDDEYDSIRRQPSATLKSDLTQEPVGKTIAFIDDWIAVPERIVDYLTQFSGIKPGDLDPHYSPYERTGHLIHLKHAYKKIWILLNMGVTFVGHGLKKDFRTINIHVPKHQVIDTVELFHRKGARQLSLRFLIWLLLGEKVQGNAYGHDSIEDARAALRLWEKYMQFEQEGRVDKVLKDIYKEGSKLGFRVPDTGEMSKLLREQTGRPVTPNMSGSGTEGSKPVTPGTTPAGTPQMVPARPALV